MVVVVDRWSLFRSDCNPILVIVKQKFPSEFELPKCANVEIAFEIKVLFGF